MPVSLVSDLQGVYIAFFNRPADPVGLAYWVEQAERAGGNVSVVINAFSASWEYQSLYAGKSGAEVVDSIYRNLFGRSAEAAGLDYWGSRLADGTFNIGTIAWSIFVGAQNDDFSAIRNKVIAAVEFTNAMDEAEEIEGFALNEGLEAAKDHIRQVDGNLQSLDDARQRMESVIAGISTKEPPSDDPPPKPLEFTLQLFLTEVQDAAKGTAADDTFGASRGTFNASDIVDGLEGADRLVVDLNLDMSPLLIAGTLKNIEAVEFRDPAGNTRVDAAAYGGIRDFDIVGGNTGILAISNVMRDVGLRLEGQRGLNVALNPGKGVATLGETFTLELSDTFIDTLDLRGSDGGEYGRLRIEAEDVGGVIAHLGRFVNGSFQSAATRELIVSGEGSLIIQNADNIHKVDAAAAYGAVMIPLFGTAGPLSWQSANGGLDLARVKTLKPGDVLHGDHNDYVLMQSAPISAAGVTGFGNVGVDASTSANVSVDFGAFSGLPSDAFAWIWGGDGAADADGETFTVTLHQGGVRGLGVSLADTNDSVIVNHTGFVAGGTGDAGHIMFSSTAVFWELPLEQIAAGDFPGLSQDIAAVRYDNADILSFTTGLTTTIRSLQASDLDTLTLGSGRFIITTAAGTNPARIDAGVWSEGMSLDLSARAAGSTLNANGSAHDDTLLLGVAASGGDTIRPEAGSDTVRLSINLATDRIGYGEGDFQAGNIDTVQNFRSLSAGFGAGDDAIVLDTTIAASLRIGNTALTALSGRTAIGTALTTATNVAAVTVGGDLQLRIDINGDGFSSSADAAVTLVGMGGRQLVFDAAERLFFVD